MDEPSTREWRPIAGVDGGYEVSRDGLVRRHDRLLSRRKDRDGYLRVDVRLGGKDRTRFVHRLVAGAFIPNPDGKPQVNHKNVRKDDNRVANLEWVTNQENARHASKLGLLRNVGRHGNHARGERAGLSKLTEQQVREIRRRASTATTAAIARQFGVAPPTIANIIKRKTWKHLG